MALHGRDFKGNPYKRQSRYVAGTLPDWIEEPGTLMRATSFLYKAAGESQIPGYMTVMPQQFAPYKGGPPAIAKLGDFGLYLGKKAMHKRLPSGREQIVTVPTFWFNGHRIVFVTLPSYDAVVIADVVYDDWFIQRQPR